MRDTLNASERIERIAFLDSEIHLAEERLENIGREKQFFENRLRQLRAAKRLNEANRGS